MGSYQRDRHLGFADLMPIGMLSVAVLLLFAIREAANPMIIIVTIALVCGIGLAIGALLAELTIFLSDREDRDYADNREAQV